MPDRFTNDRWELLAHVKDILIAPAHQDAEKTVLLFLIWPALLSEHFAIHYIKGESNRLFLRIWNHDSYYRRFSLGVFNLDHLAIEESSTPLTSEQCAELDRLISANHPVQAHEGIILDGVNFSIQIWNNSQERIMEWRSHRQLSDDTKQLINFLFKATQTEQWGGDGL